MPYVSFIRDDEPLQINVLANDMEVIGRLAIGEDTSEGTIYSLLVALVMYPGTPENHRELIFHVVEVDEDGDSFISDGRATKRFLRGDERAKVLHCLCCVILHLVDHSKPTYITMMTADTHLPPKALAKYQVVCQALTDLGYKWGKGDSYLGTDIWMIEKREP